jgi:hypothetical protein
MFPFGLFITKETTMKKTIKLTENDLNRLVTKIIQEQKTEINQEGKKRFDKLSNDVSKGFCVPVLSQGSRLTIKCQDGHYWIMEEYRQFGKD